MSFRNRISQVVTVNIYDNAGGSGWPLRLKPAAVPFVTQEDDTDDVFTPVRTQTGYLRIVDDGWVTDNNGNEVPFNWRDLIPDIATDRPVEVKIGNVVMWQGYMQAQNYGSRLYGNPQEREFPLQCLLTTAEGFDIDPTQTDIKNVAWYIEQIIQNFTTPSISYIWVQGGQKALQLMRKRIDPQLFVNLRNDEDVEPRYTAFQCLEDICRFFGYTARTWRDSLFLTCIDDSDMADFLFLNRGNLSTVAGGTAAGTLNRKMVTAVFPINQFRSVNNIDYQVQGPQKAVVQADGCAGDGDIVYFAPDSVGRVMLERGFDTTIPGTGDDVGKTLQYTKNMYAFTYPLFNGFATEGKASFNIRSVLDSHAPSDAERNPTIRILAKYNGNGFVQLDSVYEHLFYDGNLLISADIYKKFSRYENTDENSNIGKKTMYMRLGIGPTRTSSDTYWYNGSTWVQGTPTLFKVSIGNKDSILRAIFQSGSSTFMRENIPILETKAMAGRLHVDLFGSDDIGQTNVGPIIVDTGYDFDVVNFLITFERNSYYTRLPVNGRWGGARDVGNIERADTREYTADNGNRSRDEWNADCILASDNDMAFGFGVVINADNSYMTGFSYDGETDERPEQHLADRVAAFWTRSHRKLSMDVYRNNITQNYAPNTVYTFDGQNFMSTAIGYDWRNSIMTISIIDIDNSWT